MGHPVILHLLTVLKDLQTVRLLNDTQPTLKYKMFFLYTADFILIDHQGSAFIFLIMANRLKLHT